MYAEVMCKLTSVGKDAVEATAKFKEEIEDPQDVIKLWLAIKKTHIGTYGGNEFEIQAHLRQNFNGLLQDPRTDVTEFYRRYVAMIAQLVAAKVQVPADGEARAADFILRLNDAQFSEFKKKVSLLNEAKGAYVYKTLGAALKAAQEFVAKQAVESYSKHAGRYPSNNSKRTSGEPMYFAKGASGDKGDWWIDPKDLDRRSNGCWGCHSCKHRWAECPRNRDNEKKDRAQEKPKNDNGKKQATQQGKKGEKNIFSSTTAPPRAISINDGDPDIYDEDEEEELNSSLAFTREEDQEDFVGFMAKVGFLLKEDEDLEEVDVRKAIVDRQAKIGSQPNMDNLLYLDTGASRSIVRNANLCKNIRSAEKPIRVNGITGANGRITQVADLDHFGKVYFMPTAAANCLSFGELENELRIDKVDTGGFIVHIKKGLAYSFRKTNNNLYVCNVKDEKYIIRDINQQRAYIVEENKLQYSRSQVKSAELARKIQQKLGCNSTAVMIKATRVMKNMPVTGTDVYNAHKIFGPSLAGIRGTYRQKNPKVEKPEFVPRPVITEQIMYCDFLFIEGDTYLMTITKPLDLVMVVHMADKGAPDILKALNSILRHYKARQFTVTNIVWDGESGALKLREALAQGGISLEAAGSGSHVGVVEVQNKLLKEMFRGIRDQLRYRLPKFLYRYLVYYCANRRNMMPRSDSIDPTPPKEAFLGRKLDYKVDARIAFGDYVEVDAMPKQRNDATKARTMSAIALEPRGNLQGSNRFFVLVQQPDEVPRESKDSTKKEKNSYSFVIRDRWIEMPLNDMVIQRMNSIAYDDLNGYDDLQDMDEQATSVDDTPVNDLIRDPAVGVSGAGHVPLETVPDVLPMNFPLEDNNRPSRRTVVDDETVPESEPYFSQPDVGDIPDGSAGEDQQEEFISGPGDGEPDSSVITASPTEVADRTNILVPEPTTVTVPESQSDITATTDVAVARRYPGNQRSRRAPVKYTDLDHVRLAVIFHISLKKGLEKYGDPAKEAAAQEINQMLIYKVWSKVKKKDLVGIHWKKVINCFMFLKEKFKPNGEFDKLKMRLVAGGNGQDRLDYDDISSPTVLLSTVFIILTIGMMLEFIIVTVDVAGAYLNAKLINESLYMRIDPTLSAILVKQDESYRELLRKDGSIIVKLEKALYGCIESAKLWFELLSRSLIEFGLEKSVIDPCLFFDSIRQMFVTVYVDDLLVAAKDNDRVKELLKFLEAKFKTITLNEGSVVSYLGMSFFLDRKNKQAKVTMEKYVEDVLQVCEVQGNSKTPASPELFFINPNSPSLSLDEKEFFHSLVAKLLYLAKRVRPDILTAISFLATRVKEPTAQDLEKLQRVCRYIRFTKSKCIILKATGDVTAYVDASHAVHSKDGRSHTGAFVTLGEGPVFVRSTKQKLTTKSSTEAELVALSDALPMVLWIRELLIEVKYIERNKAITVMEDNQSAIALVRRGSPSGESTRHINIRYFFITDRVQSGEIIIKYCPTKLMLADYFTKAMVGTAHHEMVEKLMNDNGG